jgi:hypothetical protein
MKRKIKFIGVAVRWFDKYNGNTYHSVRITRTRDGAVIACPFEYGYGDQYRQTALEAMAKAKWLPVAYRGKNEGRGSPAYKYERENNYPILWVVSNGLKRDCINNGVL